MNQKEKEFVQHLMDCKFFTYCAECAQEIDLRKRNHHQRTDGFIVHVTCPPIRPKYT